MTGLEIAIIGMSGRFPGAPNIAAFWDVIRNGAECIRTFTRDELRAAGIPARVIDDPDYVPRRGVIDGIEEFDAELFGVTRAEAELMDPQHRLFLECAWEALEDAGCDPSRTRQPIGVYAGALSSQYLGHLFTSGYPIAQLRSPHAVLGNESDHLATRTAYKLDLRGPAVAVQTACSTSLVAVHMACQALLGGDCDLALAGGAAIAIPQHSGYVYQDGGVNSRDGSCRAFDAEASGTVSGSGVGVVLLRRLDDALAAGDRIVAIVKGSAIDNDGADKAGYTAPSVAGQARAIRLAQRRAEVSPHTIGFVETHGTGTSLGDPIEIAALTRAFTGSAGTGTGPGPGTRTGEGERERAGWCAIGALKANIGHLDAAAGVAGLIKTALVLQHRVIPPIVHFTAPNPLIDFARSPFFVPTMAMPWESEAGVPRRAAVSSLGIGGTNAHVVLEEAPPRDAPAAGPATGPATGQAPGSVPGPVPVFTLSARTPEALRAMRIALAEHLRAHPQLDPRDVACTLNVGRRQMPHRMAFTCETIADAVEKLSGDDDAGRGRARGHVQASAVSEHSQPVFMFPGQGTQDVGMGCDLFAHHPALKRTVDECLALLPAALAAQLRAAWFVDAGGQANSAPVSVRPFEAHDEVRALRAVRDVLDGRNVAGHAATSGPGGADSLHDTCLGQPALFILEYALARLWQSWGIQPRAMIGHSIGEYVAACLAGVWPLADALQLVAARGALMQATAPGAMLALPLPVDDARALVDATITSPAINSPGGRVAGRVAIAVINSSAMCVASGPEDDIAALEALAAARGITTRRVRTNRAFHSASMDSMLDAFVRVVRSIPARPPDVPIVSTVTGAWLTDADAVNPDYWAAQVRQPVLFAPAVETLKASGVRMFLEVGPGTSLSGFVLEDLDDPSRMLVTGGLPRRASASDSLQRALAQLWTRGAAIDWRAYHAGDRRQRVSLPTYPFERTRLWIDGGSRRRDRVEREASIAPAPATPGAEPLTPIVAATPIAPMAASAAIVAAAAFDEPDPLLIIEDQLRVMQAQLDVWPVA
jgi:phthiocerol/phenolphthiocerol synthesis type-I polyketide synthase E